MRTGIIKKGRSYISTFPAKILTCRTPHKWQQCFLKLWSILWAVGLPEKDSALHAGFSGLMSTQYLAFKSVQTKKTKKTIPKINLKKKNKTLAPKENAERMVKLLQTKIFVLKFCHKRVQSTLLCPQALLCLNSGF